jgi:hypothetical protein
MAVDSVLAAVFTRVHPTHLHLGHLLINCHKLIVIALYIYFDTLFPVSQLPSFNTSSSPRVQSSIRRIASRNFGTPRYKMPHLLSISFSAATRTELVRHAIGKPSLYPSQHLHLSSSPSFLPYALNATQKFFSLTERHFVRFLDYSSVEVEKPNSNLPLIM